MTISSSQGCIYHNSPSRKYRKFGEGHTELQIWLEPGVTALAEKNHVRGRKVLLPVVHNGCAISQLGHTRRNRP